MKKYLFIVFALIPLSILAQERETNETITPTKEESATEEEREPDKIIDPTKEGSTTKETIDPTKEGSTIISILPKPVYGSFIDQRDARTYKTVTIGTQVWMAENLKASVYNDRTRMPVVTEINSQYTATGGACCWYNNDQKTFGNTYGALYNWDAVKSGKLCPVGWHVPSDAEWTTLQNYLIAKGYNYDRTTTGNKIAKSMATTTNWQSTTSPGAPGYNPGVNNKSGFSGLPGGMRDFEGAFFGIGNTGKWWSSTENTQDVFEEAQYDPTNQNAWCREMSQNRVDLTRPKSGFKREYLSVRCVRDNKR